MKSLLLIPLTLAVHACGPAAIDGGFESANPAAKMYAIEDAARRNDHSAIPHIVEQLESDDPAVRSLAIAALRRMTGETFGYCDLDPAPVRREAIARWRQAIESGAIPRDGEATPKALGATSWRRSFKQEVDALHG